jgi:hypothetical protein
VTPVRPPVVDLLRCAHCGAVITWDENFQTMDEYLRRCRVTPVAWWCSKSCQHAWSAQRGRGVRHAN